MQPLLRLAVEVFRRRHHASVFLLVFLQAVRVSSGLASCVASSSSLLSVDSDVGVHRGTADSPIDVSGDGDGEDSDGDVVVHHKPYFRRD